MLDEDKSEKNNKWIDFGFKTQWIVVKDIDTTTALDILSFKQKKETSLRNAFDAIYSNRLNSSYKLGVVFKVDEWLIINSPILMINIQGMLERFAEYSSDVQYFANHRVSDAMEIERYIDGKLLRRINTDGGTLQPARMSGAETEIEKTLDISNQEFIDCEETCLAIAEEWSINPAKLSERNDSPQNVVLGLK